MHRAKNALDGESNDYINGFKTLFFSSADLLSSLYKNGFLILPFLAISINNFTTLPLQNKFHCVSRLYIKIQEKEMCVMYCLYREPEVQ